MIRWQNDIVKSTSSYETDFRLRFGLGEGKWMR